MDEDVDVSDRLGRQGATILAALLSQGRVEAVEVSGLPRPDGFYEVWLLGPGLDRFQTTVPSPWTW